MIEEREMELMAFNNPQHYFDLKKGINFNQYKLDFQFLFKLSNADLEWENKENREYNHIQDALLIKYGINTVISCNLIL